MGKHLAFVTSTRADYGLFTPLLKKIELTDGIEYSLIVTGTHLSREFGYTRTRIVDDGFEIAADVDCVLSNDTPTALAKMSALATQGITEALSRIKPDGVVVLGDRFEILSAAIAASLSRIPIVHIHGGEITEGAYDDGFRHAITKLSHVHFTATEEYRSRVIQLGEDPSRVYNVGSLGVENLMTVPKIPKKDLEKDLGVPLDNPTFLVTLHPETLSPGKAGEHADLLIDSLSKFDKASIIVTGANADSEGRAVNRKFKEFALKRENCIHVENLGSSRYASVLDYINVVIGNSSSGIIEIPSFGVPTVNIGDRQKGRLSATSVVDVPWDESAIISAIDNSLGVGNVKTENPYGDGGASDRITDQLMSTNFDGELLKKRFYNLGQIIT